jgi:hypothetical protein
VSAVYPEEVLWTVFGKKDYEFQHLWAKSPAEARKLCALNGKKRSFRVVRTGCAYKNHTCHSTYGHLRAVAFIDGAPMCPACIEQVAKPIGQRFEDIERRLEELAADLESHLEGHD